MIWENVVTGMKDRIDTYATFADLDIPSVGVLILEDFLSADQTLDEIERLCHVMPKADDDGPEKRGISMVGWMDQGSALGNDNDTDERHNFIVTVTESPKINKAGKDYSFGLSAFRIAQMVKRLLHRQIQTPAREDIVTYKGYERMIETGQVQYDITFEIKTTEPPLT